MNLKLDIFNRNENPVIFSDDSESFSILNRIKYGPRSRYDRAVSQQSNLGYRLIV